MICGPFWHISKTLDRLGQIKKNPVFRVTRPYLNLLVKPRMFFRFSGKNMMLCILKGEMPSKMNKIIFFSRKKKYFKKYVCLPYLKFSDPLPESHLFFYLALGVYSSNAWLRQIKELGDLRLSRSIIRKSRFIFMKERRTIRQKSGCLNHSNERIFQLYLQMQGRIKDSWKWSPYV